MSTFEQNPPKIKFLGGERDPLGKIYEVWQRSRDYPVIQVGLPARRIAEVKLFHQLIFDFTQIPEFCTWSWWIDGMPRSFFDQMVRYRKTAFFARSQRIRDQRGFTDRGEYLTTPRIAKNIDWKITYDAAMVMIDAAYTDLLNAGCPAEDARGLLPLHLRTGFAWSMSLRDLAQDIFRARTCHLMQQDYWAHLATQMRKDLENIDTELGTIFRPPCARDGTCISPIEAQARNDAVLGANGATKRMDLYPCRIWVKKFTKNETEQHLITKAVGSEGGTQWAPTMEETAGAYRKETLQSDQSAD